MIESRTHIDLKSRTSSARNNQGFIFLRENEEMSIDIIETKTNINLWLACRVCACVRLRVSVCVCVCVCGEFVD